MSSLPAELLAQLLRLPDKQRAGVAAELLASLDPRTPAELRSNEEWLAEIERRARAALAGSPGVPWDQARAELEQRFGKR